MVFDLLNPLWNWDEPDFKNIAVRTSFAKEKTKAKLPIGRGDANYKSPEYPVDALTHIIHYREQKLAGFPESPLKFTQDQAIKDKLKHQSSNTWVVHTGQPYDQKIDQHNIQKPVPTLMSSIHAGWLVAGIVAFSFLFIILRLKR